MASFTNLFVNKEEQKIKFNIINANELNIDKVVLLNKTIVMSSEFLKIPGIDDKHKFEQKRITTYSTEPNMYLLAVTDGNPVGFIRFKANKNKESGWFDTGVLISYRNKGIGTLLITTLINKLKDRKCKYLFLKVDKKYTQTIDFYKKIGFKDSKDQVKKDINKNTMVMEYKI